MRSLFLIFALVSSSFAHTASAADQVACAWPMCGGIHDAVLDSLAEQGLRDIDGLLFDEDAYGKRWLTILSTDARALDRVAPRSGARTTPIDGTISFARRIPISLDGIDTVTIPGPTPRAGFMKIDDIAGESGDGGGGGGGGGTSCTVVCVCTETGDECWLEC